MYFVWSKATWSPPLLFSSQMEQEAQGVCEHQDSEDREMGSDFENTEEDRERDPKERGVDSNPQDAGDRGHLVEEMDSNSQNEALRGDMREREVAPSICTGEEMDGISPTHLYTELLWNHNQGSILCGKALEETAKQDSVLA